VTLGSKSWFALYYVPPAGSALYRYGSQVFGYDVRAQAPVGMSADLQACLGDIPAAWAAKARDFGFHLTVVEAMTYDPADRDALEDEVAAVLESFEPSGHLTLEEGRLERWKRGAVWALRYRPSRVLELLQAVLVARLARFGTSSMFEEEIRRHPERYAAPYERKRLETFLSPRGLDTWEPHFTLLNPHPETENPDLEGRVQRVFGEFATVECRGLCLMVREDEEPWRIGREYPWPP
jgi:hypothetical protein